MSKAFHLTAGLGCSCLQHFVLETWGWPHMGKGNSSSRRILLGKVPSLMTCESKKFCETHFFFWSCRPWSRIRQVCPVGPQGRRLAQALP